jgi:hypothetical protein
MSIGLNYNIVVSAWKPNERTLRAVRRCADAQGSTESEAFERVSPLVAPALYEQVQEVRVHNLLPDAGLNYFRDIAQGVSSRPDEIAIGIGDTAVSVSDTELDNEKFRKSISRRFPESKRVTFQMLMTQTEGNNQIIREAGLFNGSTLIARALITPTVSKTSAILVTIAHQIDFANA